MASPAIGWSGLPDYSVSRCDDAGEMNVSMGCSKVDEQVDETSNQNRNIQTLHRQWPYDLNTWMIEVRLKSDRTQLVGTYDSVNQLVESAARREVFW